MSSLTFTNKLYGATMLKPLRNNVVVKPERLRDETRSGLIIPFQVHERKNNPSLVRSEVVAVGPGFWGSEGDWVEPDLKVGDIVYFGGINYSGHVIEEDGVEYRLLRQVDILMKEVPE